MSNGTSSKLLSKLLKICGPTNIFLYLNPSDALFHPKLYIITGEKKAYVIIGSSNFTLNGFMNNFEINVSFELDLDNDEDESIYNKFNEIYNQIKISPSSVLLSKSLIKTLENINMLNGEKLNQSTKNIAGPVKTELKKIFKTTPQKKIVTNINKISRVKSPVYIMSLVKNDVSGRRGEHYFLIPLQARDEQPDFWGWDSIFNLSRRGHFPERFFSSIIINGDKKVKVKSRLYYFKGRSEFRFTCKPIYTLGPKYAGSFIKIYYKKVKNQKMAYIELITNTNKLYSEYAKLPMKNVSHGKKYLYLV